MPQISGQLSALTLPGRRALWTTKPRTSANHRETGHTRADTCRSRSPARFRVRAIRRPSRRSRSKRPSRHSPSFAPFAVQTSVRAARAQAQADCAPADTRRPPLRLCRPCPGGPGGRRSRGCRRCRPGRKPFVGLQGRSEKRARFARYARSLWITCAIRGCHSELAFLTPGHSTQNTKKDFTKKGAGQAENQHADHGRRARGRRSGRTRAGRPPERATRHREV